ncbi:MAG: succinate dehydrogenase assembly factor 2 [Aestuariivita sp.]|nr:succinate dehydrogenase assembly factor 2 [Aestuariivita sp.]
MTEALEVRVKRLKMRSMRRGIKELDLLLGSFAESQLETMNEEQQLLYDELLLESDHDILGWLTRQVKVPERYEGMIHQISSTCHG